MNIPQGLAALITPLLLVLAACDGGAQCGSTQGFIFGTVSGPNGTDPNPKATVRAYAPDDGTTDAEMQGDGTYELNVQHGSWTIVATDGSCSSAGTALAVQACQEYPLDLHIPDCGS